MSCEGIPVVMVIDNKVVCPYCKKELSNVEDYINLNIPMYCSHCHKEIKPSKSL